MSNIIQSLWIGSELSKLEQLCLKSFIDNGHEFHLYTYEEVKNIPEGVIVKDGNEILDESEIFRYKNGSVSAFSNLFRFTMLYKKGGYWVDTDVICVRPFNFDQEIVISSEPSLDYKYNIITSCFIKMPQNSEVALAGINIQYEHKKLILSGQIEWSSGPKTVNELVQKFNLNKYVKLWQTTCSCFWDHFNSLLHPNYIPNPEIINRMDKIPDEMVCIHLWHERWRSSGIDKNNTFHPESLYELFKKKHDIN
jgi:hypothetical protein